MPVRFSQRFGARHKLGSCCSELKEADAKSVLLSGTQQSQRSVAAQALSLAFGDVDLRLVCGVGPVDEDGPWTWDTARKKLRSATQMMMPIWGLEMVKVGAG